VSRPAGGACRFGEIDAARMRYASVRAEGPAVVDPASSAAAAADRGAL
jgi:hypothetical protein